MIYLIRTTIELDGTRTTEIAALEDGAWLKRYEAQGFVAVSYEAYREAWQAKHTRVYERLSVCPASPAPRLRRCPNCKSQQIEYQEDGTWHCWRCKHTGLVEQAL